MYIYVQLHFTHSKEDIQLSDYIETQLSRDAFVVVTVFLELMPHCYVHLGGSVLNVFQKVTSSLRKPKVVVRRL